MPIPPDERPDGYVPMPPDSREDVLGRVLQEYDVLNMLHKQEERRNKILTDIRKLDAKKSGKKTGVLAFCCSATRGASIDADDIPPITDALLTIGEVERLNLIISGPGGDGITAEKIVEICRAYCEEFRVFIPNRAKSAATIVALGADEIVMGFCSEIGPIDAQVPILLNGLPHYISAQSFIDARRELEKRFKEAVAQKEDPRAILQQIAGLDVPFIDHCEKLMDFGRDVAEKFLREYMFSSVNPKREQTRRIKTVLKALSSVSDFKVHGRRINGHQAKNGLGLNVELLGRSDELWKLLWQYYVRADAALTRTGRSKLVEAEGHTLTKGTLR